MSNSLSLHNPREHKHYVLSAKKSAEVRSTLAALNAEVTAWPTPTELLFTGRPGDSRGIIWAFILTQPQLLHGWG